MDIAVLLAGLRFDSQQKIVSGVLNKALQDDANVYIFTCDIETEATKGYDDGEHNVFSLVQLDAYDGVILHGDSIRRRDLVDKLVREINAVHLPAVSFNSKHSGFMCVESENFYGIYQLVHHLVKNHGVRRINYISGPKSSSDAQDRLDAYKIALGENKIPYEEQRVYYGDWYTESGAGAMEYFLQADEEVPEAIVAANDEMALGAFYVLEELGYRIPEDVLITGYDNALVGKYHYPRLTSVKRPEEAMGELAYQMLKAKKNGESVDENKSLMCQPVYAGSCGCAERRVEDTKILRRRYVKEKNHVSTFSNIIRFSAADFTGAETDEALFKVIAYYAQKMKLQEFYLCMCEEEESEEEVYSGIKKVDESRKEYTDRMHIPLMCRNGVFSSHGSFPRKDLLPKEYTEGRKRTFYTVVPLHYQEYCYGYFVLVNNRLQIDSDLFQLFLININNALENIREKRLLNRMINQLDKMWIYDTLTGVFNRAGFFKFSAAVIDEARRRKHIAFIVFLDLDGLKQINDRYGHDEGDKYIKAIAEVLGKVRRHGELLMRYGGDEFVILAQGERDGDAERYVERVYAEMEKYNVLTENQFQLRASIGYTLLNLEKDVDIHEAIDAADQEMYKVKKRKKSQGQGNTGG